jgi:hypothetical protein
MTVNSENLNSNITAIVIEEEIGGYMGEELDPNDDGNYDREDDFFDEEPMSEEEKAAAYRAEALLAHEELIGEIYNARFYAFD